MADPVHNLALSENRVPPLQPQQGFAQRILLFATYFSARDGLSLALFNTSSVKPRNENSLRRHPEKATFAILNDHPPTINWGSLFAKGGHGSK